MNTASPRSPAPQAPQPADARTWPLVRRLLREHIRRHWAGLLVAMACMVVVAAATAANAWLMQPIMDEVFLNQNRTMLVLIPLAVFGVAIANGFASFGQHYLMAAIGQRIVADPPLHWG